jgi:curved DNA-binding protein CbpA
MASPQRPGEITYYEELGVENTASADEIRDAFRALARLLHPDQQTDPQLKEIAERQMRKVNRIYGVLSDVSRRAAYDESLRSSRNAPIIVFSGSDGNVKKMLAAFGTAGAIIVGSLLLIWFAATGNNNTEVRGQELRGTTSGKTNDNADGDAGEQITRLREQLRTVEAERDSALSQLGRLARKQTDDGADSKTARNEAASPAPDVAGAAAATEMSELQTASGVALPPVRTAPAVNEPASRSAQFAGLWVYSKASGSAVSLGGKSQYPPEFIEVTMTEANGALHGEYRSRYQVLDHAISPDVNFDFAGKPVGSSLTCLWRGPGGARGRLTLKLLPASTVEIAWNATQLGSQQWLINGTAMLVRK